MTEHRWIDAGQIKSTWVLSYQIKLGRANSRRWGWIVKQQSPQTHSTRIPHVRLIVFVHVARIPTTTVLPTWVLLLLSPSPQAPIWRLSLPTTTTAVVAVHDYTSRVSFLALNWNMENLALPFFNFRYLGILYLLTTIMIIMVGAKKLKSFLKLQQTIGSLKLLFSFLFSPFSVFPTF